MVVIAPLMSVCCNECDVLSIGYEVCVFRGRYLKGIYVEQCNMWMIVSLWNASFELVLSRCSIVSNRAYNWENQNQMFVYKQKY